MKRTDADIFISHFEQIGQATPTFHRISAEGESPPLYVLRFENLPDEGDSIAVTYGLSLVEHEQWIHGRPELILAVHSTDPAWSYAVGEVAYRLRGKCSFCYGDTIRFGTCISDESQMSAFLVFSPIVLDEQDCTVGQQSWTIHMAQLYPVYESELAVIAEKGLEYFFERPEKLFWDVNREPIS